MLSAGYDNGSPDYAELYRHIREVADRQHDALENTVRRLEKALVFINRVAEVDALSSRRVAMMLKEDAKKFLEEQEK